MTSPGGREPATRGVFALEAQELLLPNPMALDTSFVVEALIATQPLHGVCRAFLNRIHEDGVSVATASCFASSWQRRSSRSRSRSDGEASGDGTEPTDARVAVPGASCTTPSLGMTRSSAPSGISPSTLRHREPPRDLHDRLRDRVLRCSARSECHRRRCRGDRQQTPASAPRRRRLLTIYTDRSRVASCRRKRAL